MNAKERILKTLDHEEPDHVPSVELSIDNLRICKHYNVKYVFQGTGAAVKRLYDSFSGDEEKLSEFIIEQNKLQYLFLVVVLKLTFCDKRSII